DLLSSDEVGSHVGATKAVDRLLGIADRIKDVASLALEEELAEDRPLHLVGVLELVQDRVAEALAQGLDELASLRRLQRLAHGAQHVVEVEQPLRSLDSIDARLHVGKQAPGEQSLEARQHLG